jgi:hypothetical protein
MIGRQQDLVLFALQGDHDVSPYALIGMTGLALGRLRVSILKSGSCVFAHPAICFTLGSKQGLCSFLCSLAAGSKKNGLIADVVGLLTLRLVMPLARVKMRPTARDIAVRTIADYTDTCTEQDPSTNSLKVIESRGGDAEVGCVGSGDPVSYLHRSGGSPAITQRQLAHNIGPVGRRDERIPQCSANRVDNPIPLPFHLRGRRVVPAAQQLLESSSVGSRATDPRELSTGVQVVAAQSTDSMLALPRGPGSSQPLAARRETLPRRVP